MGNSKYTILRDKREKNGWSFESCAKCQSVRDWGLITGDYTAKGLEKFLCIERKASTSELANNIGKQRSRFEAEMIRMENFRWSYIICEFTLDELMGYPKNLPPVVRNDGTHSTSYIKKRRMNGPFMWKKLQEYQDKHGVKTILSGNRYDAEEKVISIFDEIKEILIREQYDE